MEKSIVFVSMKDENSVDCSYSIIQKDDCRIIIILRNSECAIFDYDELLNKNTFDYLLLKHYQDDESAYKDFLKLIGKMCKKSKDSKYFLNHIDEDNRIVYLNSKNEHMINESEKEVFNLRHLDFKKFIEDNNEKFIIQ